jgi:ribosomal protein S18 acetylase RimI-like enzyme
MSEITTRPMAYADVPRVAQLHMEAFAGSMGVELGERYVNAFLRWYIDDPTGEAIVALKEGELVGYVFGADDGYGTRQNRELLGDIARGIAAHPRVLRHKNFLGQLPNRLRTLWSREAAGRSLKATVPQGPAVFDLVGIGVAERGRGGGVGKKLIAHFAERVWKRPGLSHIVLSVYAENAAARRLYEAAGFHEVAQDGRVLYYAMPRPAR